MYKRKASLFYCFSVFFFFSIFMGFSTIGTRITCMDIRCPLPGKADLYHVEFEKRRGKENMEGSNEQEISLSYARRLLSGPGSSPPRCISKCGKCKPCKPVHVPVPPGTPVTAEYYPEAWRCKCGNKLYMP
ncbi:hypothetical protein CFOL_v3_02166 [Cephalotus follicularis]|uniref:Epidermal patterning factor-like protein n=1 Tax=Cephalotus follicularis TaxID=3775 RepID=A0A1Q3AST2_CEPFO|nr:hypothetical protein CFOL_v3_02166 [Cephalotus follicularis]